MNRAALGLVTVLAGLGAAAGSTAALAHPHVFVDAREEAVFDKGNLVAVKHVWQFDQAFSAYAVQGMGANHDGKPTKEDLAALSKVNVESLATFGFFTRVTVAGNEVAIKPPTDYHLEIKNDRLTLVYTLPLEKPVPAKGKITLAVFDPTYFVGFEFGPEPTAALTSAPAGCTSTSRPPQTLDPRTMARLSTLPIDVTELPPDLRAAAALLATEFIINCKG